MSVPVPDLLFLEHCYLGRKQGKAPKRNRDFLSLPNFLWRRAEYGFGERTVSNTKLSDFFAPHRVPGRELSEFLSAYYLCGKANSPSFWRNSPSLLQNSVSEFSLPKQNSRNNIPLVSLKMCLCRGFGHFSTFCHDFCFSGLSNDSPVTTGELRKKLQLLLWFWFLKNGSLPVSRKKRFQRLQLSNLFDTQSRSPKAGHNKDGRSDF